MGLFHNIFGMPNTTQQTGASGTKRSVPSSGNHPVTFTKGEIVKGEVTDLRSNEVTIRLNDGQTLHAKLNTAMELSIGQKADFFVQETNDVLITLKLLSDGDTSFTESAIDKALEASGLPKSVHAVSIVRSLLTAGLPANKEMIQKMMQYSASNKDVELSTLTTLLKHNLPVTKENATQLQAYRNFEHRLLGQAVTLTTALTEAFQFDTVPSSFTEGLLTHFFAESSASAEGLPSFGQPSASAEGLPSFGQPFAGEAVSSGLQYPSFPEQPTEPSSVQSVSVASVNTNQALSEEFCPLKSFLTDKEYQKLESILDSPALEGTEFFELKQDLTNGTLTANKLFSAISTVKGHSEKITSLFKEEPFLSSLLGKTLLNRFVLTPEELTKDNAIEDFYTHAMKDLAKLTELSSGQDSSAAMKTVADTASKMQENIQFMNSLNHIFPYVQLPLRLTEQLTHGELYVYTKKKDLSAKNREVSILLHLDMDALGPTDIHITLLQKNVTAKFYLNEPDACELITGQLPTFADALQKKGYTLNASVTKRTKEPDIVNDFMDSGEAVPMKRFIFDIRA